MTIIEHWTCGQDDKSVAPYKFSLDELKDLKVGEQKEMPKGCGVIHASFHNSSLSEQGMGWPDNGEFDWGDWGSSCGMASDKWGCEYFPIGRVSGQRGKVKRVAYNGDPLRCCLANSSASGTTKVIDNKTCDPDKYLNPSSYECNSLINSHCSSGENIKAQECQNMSRTNSTLYNQLMSNYCNSDKTTAKSDLCASWCSTNSSKCVLSNLMKACASKGLSEDCAQTDIDNMTSKCVKYGMLTELGTVIGDYPCTADGITKLEQDCSLYGLASGSCSSNGVNTAMQNAFAAKQNQLTRDQASEEYKKTQEAIKQMTGLNLTLESTTTPSNSNSTIITGKPDNTVYIIILIIILVLIVSSGAMLLAT